MSQPISSPREELAIAAEPQDAVRKTLRFTAAEWRRVARYIRPLRGVTEHAWLRQRILEPERVAHLTVRLARLVRDADRLSDADPDLARAALARLREGLRALYDEAASQ